MLDDWFRHPPARPEMTRARPLSRQGRDERAIGTPAARALGNGLPEDAAHGAKVCDLRLDPLQVRAGHDSDLCTRPLALVGKF
jgi:hypothetical protein